MMENDEQREPYSTGTKTLTARQRGSQLRHAQDAQSCTGKILTLWSWEWPWA